MQNLEMTTKIVGLENTKVYVRKISNFVFHFSTPSFGLSFFWSRIFQACDLIRYFLVLQIHPPSRFLWIVSVTYSGRAMDIIWVSGGIVPYSQYSPRM